MKTSARWAAAGGLLGAATLLSACASSGTSSTSSTTSSSPGTTAAAAATGSVRVGTTGDGHVLVTPKGMTIYSFAKDSKGRSACTGQCATYWPPVPSSDAPKTSTGTMTATFGSITRSDGSTQLTVNGYPMYTYAGDSSPGQANGQGQNLSGGLWWEVSPDGSWLTGSSSGTSPSPSSGTRGGY